MRRTSALALLATACLSSISGSAMAQKKSCTDSALRLLEAVKAHDYTRAAADFNAAMLAAIPAPKLEAFMKDLEAKVGPLQKIGPPSEVTVESMDVVSTPLAFAGAPIDSRIACDAEGKVAGFRLLPPKPAGDAPK